ncbi:hypothetical protein ABB37_09907 [Leptomonas pyrrhocoris]|uniref:Uncharacterized protein n=1 Tax=Leptomonas pyrrhocoris TaxID=157538 RepID=A0A0M9FPC9_LEPPY|nr:hypothetical protein ABB37_09907 [Leptomonas pyrrhocoris]KPA73350.1 hypothetical protein ABB37_09907 [Leptomonas pyrrhocoris]|eukprot:XP_015651789.1 hypothetical protein ABB37_09907 [Leptomonas pyrrhocoris]
MLSIRDIATSADDSDALQTSLQELQRRRQAKQQQRRLQRDRDADLAEADEPFGPTQELAYSREVLHAWTRWYPKLRSAVAALAAASSHSTPPPLQDTSATAAASSDTCSSFLNDDLHALRSPFSVADTIRRAYPPLWAIPAGTIPAAYYADTAFMADTSPSASAAASTAVFHHGTTNGNAADVTDCQHHHAHAGRAGGSPSSNAMTDFSRRRCPVHILREALQLPSALSVSTATAATQSAVVTPSLSPPAPAPATTPTTTPLPVWASSSTSSVSSAPLTAAGAAPLPSQQLLRPLQRILARWPPGKSASPKVSAVLRSINIEARKREQWNAHVQKLQQQSSSSSGSNCNQDTISTRHGKPAGDQAAQTSLASSALANTSVSNSMHSNILGDAPLVALSEDANGRALYWPAHITNTRAVFTGAACLRDDFQGLGLLQQYERFDVVLALALTSPMQLVVDVVYAIDETSEGFGLSIAPVVKWNEGGGDGAGHDGESAGSSAHRPPPPQAAPRWPSGESAEAAAADNDTKCPLLLPSTLPSVLSDLNYAFQPATSLPRSTTTTIATAVDEPVTAVLRRNTLSSAPLSAYDILAGPVSQSHSIVLLRPTPEVVCASRARALQELELRWKLLRQALLDRLVAYEEEPAFPVRSSAEDEGGETAGPPAVQLPNADDYESPFIDRCAVQDGDLPEEPAGAAMLTEDEMRQQTRLPELQGRRKRKRKPLPTQSTHRHQEEDGGHPSVSWSPTSPQLSAAAASTAAVSTSTYSPQPDTPALITFAPQVSSAPPPHLFSEEKLKSGSGGVQGYASSSRARHRQDVSAPTKQPRTPSDPQPAQMINLSNPTSTGVSTSYLSVVEGSHVLSAAVRAAVARQTELEDAIRRHQKPVAAPRGALPRLSVAAPSPVVVVVSSQRGTATAAAAAKPRPPAATDPRGHHPQRQHDCPVAVAHVRFHPAVFCSVRRPADDDDDGPGAVGVGHGGITRDNARKRFSEAAPPPRRRPAPPPQES